MSDAPLLWAARGLVGLGLGLVIGAQRGGGPTVIRPRQIASLWARGGPGRKKDNKYGRAGAGQPVPTRRSSR